jgi:hypothetical protein
MGLARLRCELILAVLPLLAGGALPALASAGELKPFTASYSITAKGLAAGIAEVQLEELPDGRWSYRFHTSPRGLGRLVGPPELSMSSRSVFRIREDKLIPESFAAEDGTRSNTNDQDIVFDWAGGRVRGVAERKPVDLPIQPGLLDELSVHVALMHAQLVGRTLERFVMLDGDRIKDYVFTPEGRERLKTAIGEHDTVILRINRPDSRKSTWFWCAPELGYLPLKVERRDGRSVQSSMRLEQVTR